MYKDQEQGFITFFHIEGKYGPFMVSKPLMKHFILPRINCLGQRKSYTIIGLMSISLLITITIAIGITKHFEKQELPQGVRNDKFCDDNCFSNSIALSDGNLDIEKPTDLIKTCISVDLDIYHYMYLSQILDDNLRV